MGLAYCVRQTHLLQRQDIPLGGGKKGGRRREGKGRKTTARQRTRGKPKRHVTGLFLILFPLPSFFLVCLPGRLWKGRRVRHTPNLRDKVGGGHRREDESEPVSVWVTLCVTCSVMLLRLLWLPLWPASLAFRKRNVYQRNDSLNWFTMWMWDSNFQTFAGRIPRKKEQRPESLAGPAACLLAPLTQKLTSHQA